MLCLAALQLVQETLIEGLIKVHLRMPPRNQCQTSAHIKNKATALCDMMQQHAASHATTDHAMV